MEGVGPEFVGQGAKFPNGGGGAVILSPDKDDSCQKNVGSKICGERAPKILGFCLRRFENPGLLLKKI